MAWIHEYLKKAWWHDENKLKIALFLTFCMQQNKTNQAKAYNNNNSGPKTDKSVINVLVQIKLAILILERTDSF